jgi:hypothetical protein
LTFIDQGKRKSKTEDTKKKDNNSSKNAKQLSGLTHLGRLQSSSPSSSSSSYISDPKTTNRKQKRAIYTPELIGRMTEEMLVHKATPIEIAESRRILGMPEDFYSFESVKKRAEKLRRELTQSKSTLHSPYLLLLIPFFLVRVCKGGCWQS